MPSQELGVTLFRTGVPMAFKYLCTVAVRVAASIGAAGWYCIEALRHGWQALRYRDSRIPVEVLVASGAGRWRIERELRTGLRQLQRILGELPLADVAIVVQQIITADRQLAGCCHLGHRLDGTHYALWRLALQVNGRRLSSDEILAVLAEQWIALSNQQNGSSVLVPIDVEPREAGTGRRSPTLRPDPLMPFPDGVNPHRA